MVPGTYLIRPGVLDMLIMGFKKLNNAYFKVEPAQIIAFTFHLIIYGNFKLPYY
jgi:hypothetical protein